MRDLNVNDSVVKNDGTLVMLGELGGGSSEDLGGLKFRENPTGTAQYKLPSGDEWLDFSDGDTYEFDIDENPTKYCLFVYVGIAETDDPKLKIYNDSHGSTLQHEIELKPMNNGFYCVVGFNRNELYYRFNPSTSNGIVSNASGGYGSYYTIYTSYSLDAENLNVVYVKK